MTSMGKLLAMPDETTVYCAHEYTESNAMFALSVNPSNEDLVKRAECVREARARGTRRCRRRSRWSGERIRFVVRTTRRFNETSAWWVRQIWRACSARFVRRRIISRRVDDSIAT